MTQVQMNTYAKINLFLRVVGTRNDGYHEVETILQGIRLPDVLRIQAADPTQIDVEMRPTPGLRTHLPALEDNLVWRAARSLLEHAGLRKGARITVDKTIPVGGGLGGGSSNAAGALSGLNDLWELGFDEPALHEIARRIGSDVPYCLSGGTALATGRGDELAQLPAPRRIWLVLGISDEPLSTSAVYGAFDHVGRADEVRSAPMTMALGAGDVSEIASLLHNDLERAAFGLRPDLVVKKRCLVDAGALGAGMSGSGPTMFAIAKDEQHAQEIAGTVGADFDRVVVVPSHPVCIERVH